MARKRVVSRAFKGAEVQVLAMNIETAEPFNKTIELPIQIKNEDKLLAYLRENFDTDETKIVHVVSYQDKITLRAMTEVDFIANSYVLDPETRKPLDTDTVEEIEE